jgi:hypothetical protein
MGHRDPRSWYWRPIKKLSTFCLFYVFEVHVHAYKVVDAWWRPSTLIERYIIKGKKKFNYKLSI